METELTKITNLYERDYLQWIETTTNKLNNCDSRMLRL